jgi:hypothetical protein
LHPADSFVKFVRAHRGKVTPMRIASAAVMLVVIFASDLSRVGAAQATGTLTPTASQTISTFCAGCHNGVMRSPSGVLLHQFVPGRVSENRDAWTLAYRQLQAGTMPPVGAPRPDRQASGAVLASIEAALGVHAAPPPDATSQEIADRLAQLLWNGAPDALLLDDARRNRLTDAATLERQITRMLNDNRARAFVERFFVPWLGLDRLAKADPDKVFFPDYDVSLRDAMARETELFLLSQLREDRDPIEIWSANYTFLNEQLARHYGVPGVAGAEFRRVPASPERAGLLGHGSVHMVTSKHRPAAVPGDTQARHLDAAFTSPAARGLWVRLHFLGAAAPQPFPNAPPLRPELPITPATRTLPAEPCVKCHRNFFPLGYALENFDPLGRWRTRDQAGAVDASGTFVDGTPTNGVVELRNVLLQRPDAFRTTVTEQLLAYASGRPLNASRMTPDTLVRARQILNGAQTARWSSIIAGVVRSQGVPKVPGGA